MGKASTIVVLDEGAEKVEPEKSVDPFALVEDFGFTEISWSGK